MTKITQYITSKFIKILNIYGPNPAPIREFSTLGSNYKTCYHTSQNIKRKSINYMSTRKKVHTNCFGVAGFYFKYIPSVMYDRFNSRPGSCSTTFPSILKDESWTKNIEIEPVSVLTLGKRKGGKRRTISRNFTENNKRLTVISKNNSN